MFVNLQGKLMTNDGGFAKRREPASAGAIQSDVFDQAAYRRSVAL